MKRVRLCNNQDVWYTDFQLPLGIIVPDSATEGSIFPPGTTVLPEFHPENQGPIIYPREASLAPALNPRPARKAIPTVWRD